MEEVFKTCPECGSPEIHVRFGELIFSEKNELYLFCETCGFLRVFHKPFYFDAWYRQILGALVPIDILYSLLSNEETPPFLLSRLEGISYLSSWVKEDKYRGYRVPWSISTERLKEEMESALNVYLSQLLVLAFTYAEAMVKDFLDAMNEIDPKRTSSSKKILREKGLDSLLQTWINEFTLSPQKDIVNDLRQLRLIRNRIVHEYHEKVITLSEVHMIYGMLIYCLYLLGEVAIIAGIPFVDEFGEYWQIKNQGGPTDDSQPTT